MLRHADGLKEFVVRFRVGRLRPCHFKLPYFFLHLSGPKNLRARGPVFRVNFNHGGDELDKLT